MLATLIGMKSTAFIVAYVPKIKIKETKLNAIPQNPQQKVRIIKQGSSSIAI